MTPQELSVRNKQELKGEEQTRPGRTYVPDVDICESADSLWLWADMPGVDEESIQVNLADGVLSIEGLVSLQDYENLSPVYTESLHKDHHGEWDFNLDWKPLYGFAAYFAWVKAVTDVQSWLHKHSNITVPILLMYSDKSFKPKSYTEETQRADTVLNVSHITEKGMALGSKVTKAEIKDGMHDLFLSSPSVRKDAFTKMFQWLNTL